MKWVKGNEFLKKAKILSPVEKEVSLFVAIHNDTEALSKWSIISKRKHLVSIFSQSLTEKEVYFDKMTGRGNATLPK